jgi:asparagine synthase (glutamine-hydrolysing)
MCGIAGMVGHSDETLVRSMTDALAHRGPDDSGFHVAENVALGHRRLSIIDLDGGHQPMPDASGKRHLVFNGEIYNYRELRDDLGARGYPFQTESDTEVILAAYDAWGVDCVDHLRGMFAFALWDSAEQRLFVARDRLGVKPLYYAQVGDRLYFGSEMKALLQVPEVDRGLDYAALDDYLTFLYTVPPRTFYQGIRQVPPAHCGVWEAGRFTLRRYWSVAFEPEPAREIAAWCEELDAALRESVALHRIADVPLGAFLSGGLDSACIVGELAQAGGAVDTFTIGFESEGALYDESNEAAALARHFGTRHHPLTVSSDMTDLMPVLLRGFDEPFANPTALLTYALSAEVRKHVKVILSGDGGDEVFGGYPRYQGMILAERLRGMPGALRDGLFWLTRPLPESTRGAHALRRIRQFAEGARMPADDRYARWLSYFTPEQRSSLYTEDARRAVGDHDSWQVVRDHFAEAGTDDPVAQALYCDLNLFLPCNVLQYGDRMSMAHGLETRVPLADHRIVELMARVPTRLKCNTRASKILLRERMRAVVPETDRTRPKRGFNPPMGQWLQTGFREMIDDCLCEESVRARGLFEPRMVQRLREDHDAGRRDHTWHLWALLVLEAWQRAR